MTYPNQYLKRGAERRGFSLIELLVTVALLAVIILGLVAMFNQTRRAFTTSITQVDVLQSGRSAADLVARELEQMAPASVGNAPNFYLDSPLVNMGATFLIQPLVDPNETKTNNLQEVFYVTRYNQQWNLIGYKVFTPASGVGTLYRFSSNNIALTNLIALATNLYFFTNASVPSTNFSALVDGVVDFRVRVFDTNGSPFISYTNGLQTIFVRTNGTAADYSFAVFESNSLPPYVEVELGILEDRALAKYQSLTNSGTAPGSVAWNYLVNHPGQVHVFRQRVTIHDIDPTQF